MEKIADELYLCLDRPEALSWIQAENGNWSGFAQHYHWRSTAKNTPFLTRVHTIQEVRTRVHFLPASTLRGGDIAV